MWGLLVRENSVVVLAPFKGYQVAAYNLENGKQFMILACKITIEVGE